MSIDESGDVLMCVNEENTVHDDGKGHSGLFLTMGQGAIMNASKS